MLSLLVMISAIYYKIILIKNKALLYKIHFIPGTLTHISFRLHLTSVHYFLYESGCKKTAHNVVAGNLHKAGAAFVTLKEN